MKLSGLLLESEYFPEYDDILRQIAGGGRHSASQFPVIDPAKPYLLACLQRDIQAPILVVTSSAQRARQLVDQLQSWSELGALVYGEKDALFYERISSDLGTLGDRLRVLAGLIESLSHSEVPIIVASARALMQKIMEPDQFVSFCRRLSVGDVVNVNSLLEDLLKAGYRPEQVVDDIGTFARRGGIIDIYSPTGVRPFRIELFGDEIDTIREFDPATQRSSLQLDTVFISPARETKCDSSVLVQRLSEVDLSSLRPEAAEQWLKDVEAIRSLDSSDRLGFYDAFGCEATLLSYLPEDALVFLDEPSEIKTVFTELDEQAARLRQELVDLGELPPSFPQPYVTWQQFEHSLSSRKRIDLGWRSSAVETYEVSPVGEGGSVDASPKSSEGRALDGGLVFRAVATYGGRIKSFADDIANALRDSGRVVVVTQQAKRLLELLEERGIQVIIKDNLLDNPPGRTVTVLQGELPEGFELVSSSNRLGFVLLTDGELFGWSKRRRVAPRRAVRRDFFISELEVGSYVVHVEHGVGRFQGLTHLAENGIDREYMILEYAEGDRLFVPADQLGRVSKYIGAGDHAPRLHRLGSGDWARLKEKVKAAVRDIAKDLLEIYAAREVKPGFAFSPDTVWQNELEESFPYLETPDQARAIAETKADMEKHKPMDRLICGDVGYGKTEVALRAAFKAVMDGKQVAILVPTTVLAQQHHDTFRERMQAFPVKIEMLSRFRTEKEQQVVLEGLRAGVVDICIGTHRLIQKDVEFKELGLVIIDEEQRFGVVHKERLKQLRKEVDVLTLTATPIPRTLYLALSGVRDMSTIDTPPEERLPIKTYVTEYNPRLIREAILRELDRGGQVYFVHNRVQSIGMIVQRLMEIVPEALIEVGHGQMPEDRLEKVMVDFAAGKFDVLVCTTIIESGIDIPNVNTIIINQADRFGLSQLYQLRGRVGRGANRAYAYFLTSREKRLTPTAEKRLRTIFEATELGSGFRIAMRDLEIRGAGNLLGAEQHGHVAAVGFDLYCRLLADAVKEFQGKPVEARPEVTISLPVAAYIPDDYVTNESLRINLYQRMSNARSLDEVGNLVLEMRDRFGELPKPVLDLAYLLQLKVIADRAGVKRIEMMGDNIIITANDGVIFPREDLRREFGSVLTVGHTQVRLGWRQTGGKWLGVLGQIVEQLDRASVH